MLCLLVLIAAKTGIIPFMGSANARRRHIVKPPLIGWANT